MTASPVNDGGKCKQVTLEYTEADKTAQIIDSDE